MKNIKKSILAFAFFLLAFNLYSQDTSKFTVAGWHYERKETFVLLKMQCTAGDRYLVFMAPKITDNLQEILNYDYPIRKMDAETLFPFFHGSYAKPQDGREIGQILSLIKSIDTIAIR